MRGPSMVEQEENFRTNKLRKRLKELQSEKQSLNSKVSAEEEPLHKLQKLLEELRAHQSMMTREKANLENELEQALETMLEDQIAPLSDTNGRCWSGTEP